jgi:cytoskeletal protein CcmA (bactofilin family)
MQFKKGKEADEIVSLLGEGAELNGEISFTNGLRVDGVVKGKVRSEAALVIGRTGKVNAEINVKKISISGEFHGVIRASDRVEIYKDGKVYGDIFSPCLIIEAGAIFEGRCNMSERRTPKQEEGSPVKAIDSNSEKTTQLAAES